jgi:uncharacterized protein
MPLNKRFQTRLGTIIAVCLASLIPLSALGQKPQKARSMMWRVTSGKNTAYVLGSLHSVTKDFYPFPKEVDDAFEGSEKLVVEVDITKPRSGGSSTDSLASRIYTGENETLWSHLDEKTADRLKRILAAKDMRPERFEIMKPGLVALELDRLVNQKHGLQATVGIDMYFLIRSLGKKQVVELETLEFQQQIFHRQTEDIQIRNLIATLDRLETKRDYVAEMFDSWLKGDGDQLDQIFSDIYREPAELGRQIREGRNPRMAEAVESCIQKGDRCFVIVGAAHVVGKEGIINILKNKGYLTEQVSVKNASSRIGSRKSDTAWS